MRKILVMGLLVILMILAVFQLRADTVTEYRVGVIGDFSARNSTASVDAFRAIELAVEKLNTSEKIYTLVRFDIGDGKEYTSLVKDIEAEQIDFILGPSTSSQYLMTKEALEELDIPVFLIAVSSNAVNNIDDNLFRLTDTLDIQVENMSTIVENLIGGDKINILFTTVNKGFSQPYAEDLKMRLSNDGLKVTVEEVNSLELEETRQILLSKMDTDAFVVIAGPSQAGIIAQLLDVKNSSVPIFFTTWSKDERTIEYSKNVRNDMYILSSPEPKSINEYEAFIHSLEEYKSVTMNSFAYFGYEIMFFADYIIGESQSVKLKDVKVFIHGLNTYQGNYNEFKFNDMGDGGRGYTVMTIRDGMFKLLPSNLE